MTQVVATFRDLTEKRRLQEALVHAQRLDAVGRLAGGVAHDFNNLLAVINGYCEILAAHVAMNPQALREVAEIHNAGRKAAALTQQLLAFSRRQPFNSIILNLNSLAHENTEILRRFVGEAGRIDFDLAEGLANVKTDSAQFQQVLLNLVLNARDALRDRGRIMVRTSNRLITRGLNCRATDTPPGRYVVLTVEDNGTGMDAETQQHLLEPFFTTKPARQGHRPRARARLRRGPAKRRLCHREERGTRGVHLRGPAARNRLAGRCRGGHHRPAPVGARQRGRPADRGG